MEDLSHRISNSLDLEQRVQRKMRGIFGTDRVGTNTFSDYEAETRLKELNITHISSNKLNIF